MRWRDAFLLGMAMCGAAGCAVNVPTRLDPLEPGAPVDGAKKTITEPSKSGIEANQPIIIGRVVTFLLGPTTRWYEPAVRFIELTHRATQQRYQVMIERDDRHFILELPSGDYELSRVQISEGPFMSLADLHETFTVLPERLTYVGTWRFGVDIPKYGRKVLVSIIEDDESHREAERRTLDQYPQWANYASITALPEPVAVEARLYEVASYPRIPRYFRRHWW